MYISKNGAASGYGRIYADISLEKLKHSFEI
jgi:hypothetical protein